MDHQELTSFLLKSNVPPSDTESKRFQELIRAEEAKYQIIAADIEGLSEQRQAIQNQIQAFKNVVSPARRLPPETVINIFRFCAELECEIFPHPLAVPLLLTQICSGWRQVALQMHQLWTALNFHVEENDFEHMHNLAKTWIERCRHHTFSLYIQSFDMLPDPFLDLVTIRPAMIHSLDLEIPYDALAFLEKLPLEVVFPNLETLTVDASMEEADLEEDWLLWPESVRVFESAPKLEVVTMKIDAEGFNPAELHLPWHQLEELYLNQPPSPVHIPYNNVRATLHKCTSLRVCVASLDARSIEEDLDGVITLPHLKVLGIIINVNLGIHFFESMVLPQLTTLTLFVLPAAHSAVDLRPLANLQRASNFSLTSFALMYMDVDQDVLLELLRLMPCLRDLSLTFVLGLGEVFFSTLKDNNADTALLPHLSTLSTDYISFPIPNLQPILESRVYPSDLTTSKPPTVAKLESLTFIVDVNFDDSVFKTFVGRGLELSLNRAIGRQRTPEPASEEES